MQSAEYTCAPIEAVFYVNEREAWLLFLSQDYGWAAERV